MASRIVSILAIPFSNTHSKPLKRQSRPVGYLPIRSLTCTPEATCTWERGASWTASSTSKPANISEAKNRPKRGVLLCGSISRPPHLCASRRGADEERGTQGERIMPTKNHSGQEQAECPTCGRKVSLTNAQAVSLNLLGGRLRPGSTFSPSSKRKRSKKLHL
jgi:hypothetical protein